MVEYVSVPVSFGLSSITLFDRRNPANNRTQYTADAATAVLRTKRDAELYTLNNSPAEMFVTGREIEFTATINDKSAKLLALLHGLTTTETTHSAADDDIDLVSTNNVAIIASNFTIGANPLYGVFYGFKASSADTDFTYIRIGAGRGNLSQQAPEASSIPAATLGVTYTGTPADGDTVSIEVLPQGHKTTTMPFGATGQEIDLAVYIQSAIIDNLNTKGLLLEDARFVGDTSVFGNRAEASTFDITIKAVVGDGDLLGIYREGTPRSL